MVQVIYITLQVFLGIFYSILLCKALKQSFIWVLVKLSNLKFFLPIILLNKWSPHFTVLQNPLWVCCCIKSDIKQTQIFMPTFKRSTKQNKSLWSILFLQQGSAVTESNELKTQICASIHFGSSLQIQIPFAFSLNSTYTHVNNFNYSTLNTLAQLNIRVHTCNVPWTTFVRRIFTKSQHFIWSLL